MTRPNLRLVHDEPIDLYQQRKIVEHYERLAREARRDPAEGGRIGLGVMIAVAVLIGVLLATGGVL